MYGNMSMNLITELLIELVYSNYFPILKETAKILKRQVVILSRQTIITLNKTINLKTNLLVIRY